MTVPWREKRNVFALAVRQMLFDSGRTLMTATAPVIAYTLATEKALATLPIAPVIVGTAITTFPASIHMGRAGRKAGFLLGTLSGAIGGLVCAAAVAAGSLSSGVLLHYLSWAWLNILALPLIAVALAAALWYAATQRRAEARPA